MSPIRGGAATRRSLPPSAVSRRERDLAGLAESRPDAEAAALALLRALLSVSTPTAELEARARAAYDAIGRLWEHAARLK